jgi:hypothetical protein
MTPKLAALCDASQVSVTASGLCYSCAQTSLLQAGNVLVAVRASVRQL